MKELDITVRYYISSAQLSPKEMLEATRSHWSIESLLHWRLDVGMREDDCRIRREQAGENMAAIRHMALNALSSDTSFKAGIKSGLVIITITCRKSCQGWGFRNLVMKRIRFTG